MSATADVLQAVPTIATAATNTDTYSANPFLMALTFLLCGVLIAMAIAKPIMGMWREYKSGHVTEARVMAETSLYQQLQEQIKHNTESILRLEEEKNAVLVKAHLLETEVAKLIVFEDMVKYLREQLALKQKQIEAKDAQLEQFMGVISELKDRLHALELRLLEDERSICGRCSFRKSVLETDKIDDSPLKPGNLS